jgi:hypothetical protein
VDDALMREILSASAWVVGMVVLLLLISHLTHVILQRES